jgi:hypothetical protein
LVSDSREEHRLKIFENRVLRRIFGPNRDELIGGWWKLHNEELHNLYCSPIIRMIKSRRMRWTECVIHTGKRIAYRGTIYFVSNSPKGRESNCCSAGQEISVC